ncbi:unnamed protein product, partial [Prorocentrum cordatum]
ARDRFLALSDADFELLSATLAASDKHSLRQSPFLLHQQLGTFFEIKTVKSAQAKADEACKWLQQAKVDYEKKQKLAAEALQASFMQKEKVAQLQVELDSAASRAKAALANDTAPTHGAAPKCDVGELIGHAQNLEGVVGASLEIPNLQLSEDLPGPLPRCWQEYWQLIPEPVAAGGGAAGAPASGCGAAAGAAAADVAAGDGFDVDLVGGPLEFATGDAFQAAASDFVGSDPAKRESVEDFQSWSIAPLRMKSYSNVDRCLIEDRVGCDVISAAVPSLAGWLATGGLLARVRSEHGLAAVLGSRPFVPREGRVRVYITLGHCAVTSCWLTCTCSQALASTRSTTRPSLKDLACRLREHGRPCAVGGDFDCAEQELAKLGAQRLFDAVVADTSEPACAQSKRTIDLFIVSRGLKVTDIRVVSGSPVYPRKLVILELEASRRKPRVRVAEVPEPFPAQRPARCDRHAYGERWSEIGQELQGLLAGGQERVLDQVERDSSTRGHLTIAWQRFLDAAEDEWIDIYLAECDRATWAHSVASALLDVAAGEQPRARLGAFRGSEFLSCPQVLPQAVDWWMLLSSLPLPLLGPVALQQLHAGARAIALELAERDMAQRTAQFQQRVKKQARGGGGGLRAAPLLPIGFDPSPIGEAENDGGLGDCRQLFDPMDLGQQVTQPEVEWSRWWRTSCEHVRLHWPSGLGEGPPRPSVQELREVLRSFRATTGMSFCAVRPRQLDEICDEASEVLTDIPTAIERGAAWPRPQVGGGKRSPMPAGDGAPWHQTAIGEWATQRGADRGDAESWAAVAALLDLLKAPELHCVPAALCMGSAASSVVEARQSILPGDGFATSLLKLILIGPLYRLVIQRPTASLAAVVDDLMLHRVGGLARVTKGVAEAAFKLKTLLMDVDLDVAVK